MRKSRSNRTQKASAYRGLTGRRQAVRRMTGAALPEGGDAVDAVPLAALD